jgi:hypothetical protein
LLRRHIREAHPNLLGSTDTFFSYRPLPNSGLSEVPDGRLFAIHEANHAGLYRQHLNDGLLPSRRKPIQIDPPGCDCTECITGEYIPMDRATDQQLWEMLMGKLNNATGFANSEFRVESQAVIARPER